MEAVIAPYTYSMGSWFYLIVLFLGMIMIYMKTQNFGTTIISGLVLSAGFFPILYTMSGYTPALSVIYGFIVLGIAAILYKIFRG